MKKITLFCGVLLANLVSIAQVTFEGSKEFGRIFDVLYHPNTVNELYATTLGSHIVSSKDNGMSWNVFYSHPTNYHNIERLKFINEDKISFNLRNGIFDNHLHVLDINTNQITQTFVLPIPESASRTWITDYDIWQENTNIAMVSQGYNIGFASFYKVYYTNNGGTTWNSIYSSIDNNGISVNSVAISPDNPQKLFITRGNGPEAPYGGILISANSGQNWTERLTGISIDPIAINPQNGQDILIGTNATAEFENLYRSSDGGSTWQPIAIEWQDYVSDNIVHISFNRQNPNAIIVLEENQVITTTNSFQTYTNTTFEEDPNGYYYGLNASHNPYNSTEIVVSGNYHPLRTTDNGITFSKIYNPFFTASIVNLFKENNIKKHFYYGVQFGYVHKNIDTGNTNGYNILPLNMISNGQNQIIVDPIFNGRVYNLSSSFFGGSLKISNDHGATDISIPVSHQYLFAVGSQATNATKIWVSFYEGDLEGNDGSVVYEIDFSNPNEIIALPINLPVFKPVTSIYIDPNNYNNKIIALASRIYKTSNNGQTWQISSNGLENILSLDNDIIFKIIANPMNINQLTISTSQGIFTSYDNGTTWSQIGTNLVEQIYHSPFNNGVIIAASYTRDYSDFNVYYSTDMGENWSEVSNASLFNPNVYTSDFNFIPNAFEIYASTNDLGVIRYTVNLENLNTPGFEVENAATLWPNPGKESLFLTTNEEIYEILCFDVTGKKVHTINNSFNKIDISGLSAGMYLLKINFVSGKFQTIRFLKE